MGRGKSLGYRVPPSVLPAHPDLFSDEETKAQRGSDLPKATWLRSGRARTRATPPPGLASWCEEPLEALYFPATTAPYSSPDALFSPCWSSAFDIEGSFETSVSNNRPRSLGVQVPRKEQVPIFGSGRS